MEARKRKCVSKVGSARKVTVGIIASATFSNFNRRKEGDLTDHLVARLNLCIQ